MKNLAESGAPLTMADIEAAVEKLRTANIRPCADGCYRLRVPLDNEKRAAQMHLARAIVLQHEVNGEWVDMTDDEVRAL